MSKFESIALSLTVVQSGKVNWQKGLFGKYAAYAPTHSRVDSYRNFYAEQEAERVLQLINASADEADSQLEQLAGLNTIDKGPVRMDLCMSRDHQFIALQLFRQSAQGYVPISEVTYLEGRRAELFEDKLL